MSDLSRTRLLLVGCGKMGGAMLRGWLARAMNPSDIVIVEPSAEALGDLAGKGIAHVREPGGIAAGFVPHVVVLALKPQFMDGAIDKYARFARPQTLFLSIAAGKTIAYFQRHLGAGAVVLRAMPNTPAAIGRGISVAVADRLVSAAQRELAQALLAACGEVAWVEDEDLINAVTALSGGGPAYVFLLIEAMAEAGRKTGLPADLAMRLARVTVSGAGELAHLTPESAAQLRQNVTSPKGTTLEALNILMAPDGIQPLFDRAIAAATRRSRELAG
jgi:pyrroline-5-carboxylate reductase